MRRSITCTDRQIFILGDQRKGGDMGGGQVAREGRGEVRTGCGGES